MATMATLIFASVVLPTMALKPVVAPLEIYGDLTELGDFSFTDHTGAALTARELRGRIVIANFIFTRCPTVCPVFSAKMRRVQERTEDAKHHLKLLSITADPTYDTPEVLAEYADEYHADAERWRFATGNPEDVRRIASEGLKVALDQAGEFDSGVPNILHSEHFILIDHQLRIRGYYHSGDPIRIETMLVDARRLIVQAGDELASPPHSPNG